MQGRQTWLILIKKKKIRSVRTPHYKKAPTLRNFFQSWVQLFSQYVTIEETEWGIGF